MFKRLGMVGEPLYFRHCWWTLNHCNHVIYYWSVNAYFCILATQAWLILSPYNKCLPAVWLSVVNTDIGTHLIAVGPLSATTVIGTVLLFSVVFSACEKGHVHWQSSIYSSPSHWNAWFQFNPLQEMPGPFVRQAGPGVRAELCCFLEMSLLQGKLLLS